MVRLQSMMRPRWAETRIDTAIRRFVNNDNHERIAKIWSVLLDKDVSVSQVYQCMVAVKLARLIVTPEHEDSWIDICGYGALGGED